jgi:hypothetical protein
MVNTLINVTNKTKRTCATILQAAFGECIMLVKMCPAIFPPFSDLKCAFYGLGGQDLAFGLKTETTMDHVKDGHFCNYGPKDVILLDNRLNTASGWFSNNDLVYTRSYEAFNDFIIKLKEDDVEGIFEQLDPEELAHFNKIWLIQILVL